MPQRLQHLHLNQPRPLLQHRHNPSQKLGHQVRRKRTVLEHDRLEIHVDQNKVRDKGNQPSLCHKSNSHVRNQRTEVSAKPNNRVAKRTPRSAKRLQKPLLGKPLTLNLVQSQLQRLPNNTAFKFVFSMEVQSGRALLPHKPSGETSVRGWMKRWTSNARIT